jgi:hypothetical protein
LDICRASIGFVDLEALNNFLLALLRQRHG